MICTVTFNPAIDYVVHLGGFLPGEINRSSGEEIYFGGKGINVAVVLRRLGLPVTALGFLAGFTGAAIEQAIRAEDIDCNFVRLPGGFSRINVKIKSDCETELNGQGPDIPPESLDLLMERLEKLGADDTLVLAGSIPHTLPEDIYEKILARLSGRGIRFAVDATGELLANVLRYRPFLIKPNDRELAEIVGRPLESEEEIFTAARELRERGAQNVLISMAGRGALLLDERGEAHRIGAARGRLVNSVGAGDSMVAGFLAGYLTKGDYAYALRLGTACGGATAFSPGLAEKNTIEEVLGTL